MNPASLSLVENFKDLHDFLEIFLELRRKA